MAVDVTYLNSNSVTNIDANFERTKEALEKALGREGDLPNHMETDLDMNGNDILNVDIIQVQDITIDGDNATGILERALEAVGDAEGFAEDSENSAIDSANSAAEAAGYAAGLNLPAITAGTTNYQLNVNLVEDGYDLLPNSVRASFPTVAGLLADTSLDYTRVSPGDIITAQGFRYEVAASDAVDFHVETAGGLKLRVLFTSALDITALLNAEQMDDVKTYGYTVDCSEAMNLAFSISDKVDFPAGGYLAQQQLIMHPNQLISGAGRKSTFIRKGFDGDLFEQFSEGAGFVDITLEGDGENFSGGLLPVKGSSGRQYADRFAFLNSRDAALDFETNAGSQSCFIDGTITRYNGTISDEYCSVSIAPEQQLVARPRKFIGIETNGTYFIDFGGSNNTFSIGCWAGGYKFGAESRAVYVIGGRWANQSSCTVRGNQVVINGDVIVPTLTLEGIGPISVGPGYLINPVIDNGIGNNTVYDFGRTHLVEWTASGSLPDVGNGNIRSTYSRQGDLVHLAINLTIGSETDLGTGAWRFSLPVPARNVAGVIARGIAYMIDTSAGLSQLGCARVLNEGTYLEIQSIGSTDLVGHLAPWTWGAGDTLHITIDYQC